MKLSNDQHDQVVSLAISAAEADFDATVAALEAVKTPKSAIIDYTFTVNYDQSLKAMIKAGKYNWYNPNITKKHFLIAGTGEKEVKATPFHFNREISTEDVIAEMNKVGYRPAKLAELLKFGAIYPDQQEEFPILALGQFWTDPRDGRVVPGLIFNNSARGLYLELCDENWREICRFLGVKK